MFAVIFEVHPKPEREDSYLGYAKLLRPELEAVEGFVDNVRYRSLTRDGWLLSLSGWRDEKALVRWRTKATHHAVQGKGRSEVFRDYHLRVGEITRDTGSPEGRLPRGGRQDETRVGDATTVTLIDGRRRPGAPAEMRPDAVAASLGLPPGGPSPDGPWPGGLLPGVGGLVGWDVFDAVLTPGDTLLLASWRDEEAALAFEGTVAPAEGVRLRRVRVLRDYGMFDRREAPQYHPDVEGAATLHA